MSKSNGSKPHNGLVPFRPRLTSDGGNPIHHNFSVLLSTPDGDVRSIVVPAIKVITGPEQVIFLGETGAPVGEFCYHSIIGWFDGGPVETH